MSLPKAAVFCWSGDARRAAFFLEEALGEWSASASVRPLLVDCRRKKKPDLSLYLRAERALPLSSLRFLGETSIPVLRGSALPHAVEAAAKKGDAGFFEDATLILLPERGAVPACAGFASDFLFFAPAQEKSLNDLRELTAQLGAREGKGLRISIVVSGIETIEEAAAFFLGVREGLSEPPRAHVEIRFAGHFFLNGEKERIAEESGKRYGLVFPQDGLYGQLKAIGRRWLPSLSPAAGRDSLSGLADGIADEIADEIAALSY